MCWCGRGCGECGGGVCESSVCMTLWFRGAEGGCDNDTWTKRKLRSVSNYYLNYAASVSGLTYTRTHILLVLVLRRERNRIWMSLAWTLSVDVLNRLRQRSWRSMYYSSRILEGRSPGQALNRNPGVFRGKHTIRRFVVPIFKKNEICKISRTYWAWKQRHC